MLAPLGQCAGGNRPVAVDGVAPSAANRTRAGGGDVMGLVDDE